MSIQRYCKLNLLQRILPEGLPVDSTWLQNHGYSRQLTAKYVQHGWLESPVRGVFLRKSAHIDEQNWEPTVISLQSLLDVPVVVGGRTALDLHGHSHYLSMSNPSNVHLYGHKLPPSWIAKLKLRRHFIFHSALLFKPGDGHLKSKEYRSASFAEHKWAASDWTIKISTPERAILESVDELPNRETFHQLDMLMEGLVNLRPHYVSMLLSNCRSVKTKRLFLWFAHRHHHPWIKLIETEKIDLGKGKRMIAPGGKLDQDYLITVPEEFAK